MLVEEVDNLGKKGRWKTVHQSFFESPVSVVFNFLTHLPYVNALYYDLAYVRVPCF